MSTTSALRVRLDEVIGRIVFVVALLVIAAVAVVVVVRPNADPQRATASPAQTAARPSPSVTVTAPTATRTTAASATPSAAVSPSASPASLPPAGCAALSGGSEQAQGQITAIRAAHQPGMDRVVFEFGPSGVGPYGLPPWAISVASSFTGTSNQRVTLDGNAFLGVRFRNASTVDPQTGRQTFTQTDIRPGLPLVREIKLIDDFERVVAWGIGLDHLVCPKVTELASPARLVVDLPSPP